jgi:putative thiamine transport system permease protein
MTVRIDESRRSTSFKEARSRVRPLKWAPAATLAFMVLPVSAGLLGTFAPALGWMPALGSGEPGLREFAGLVTWAGFSRAAWLSVTTGLGTTILSLAIVTLVSAGWQGTRSFRLLERALSPLLSVPHAAAAFGIAFLIAPSGWVSRAFSPWATGWSTPPDVLILQDPAALSLILGLVTKEIPFLFLMTLAALGQTDSSRSHMTFSALGYGRVSGWLKTVFPRVYAQIRLPVYAVLAYSMSVVDVAIILGPNTPPTLSVQIVRWFHDPDLDLRFRAAAGAVVQLALVIAVFAVWRALELAVARLGRAWIERGGRFRHDGALRVLAILAAAVTSIALVIGIAGLAVWSFAGFWSFPDLLPEAFTLRSWERHLPSLLSPLRETVVIGFLATAIALLMTLSSLESEYRHGVGVATRNRWILYLPLLVPQVAFLLGLQTWILGSGLTGGRIGVIWMHSIFVLPYVFLSLAGPFRAWDDRYARVANALGAGPDRVFWRIRLPMMLRPIMTAVAVGFAVSVGQYLPTLLTGAGRVQTLTTEAVALASGGDRRIIAIFALAQTAAALIPFLIAIRLPRLVWRNRRALDAI